MATIILPWQKDFPAFEMSLTLENSNFNFRIKWNDTYSYWTLDILTAQNDLILAGLKLLPSVELIRRHRDTRLPPGFLFVAATEGALNRLDYTDLGSKAQLVYIEASGP